MCLCFYHVYTFSNRRAYIRLLYRLFNKKKSEQYLKASLEGWIHVVREFGPFWRGLDWDRFPIEDLQGMERAGGFFTVYYYQFYNWETLRRAIKEIGAAKFLFGKVSLQLGVP